VAAFGIVLMVLANRGMDRVTSGLTIGAVVVPLIALLVAAWTSGPRVSALLAFAVPPFLLAAVVSTRLSGDIGGLPVGASTALFAAAGVSAAAAWWSTARSKPSPVRWLMGGLAGGIFFVIGVWFAVIAWLFRNG
jgi:hypothetical protein